jgi:hypothetical protein
VTVEVTRLVPMPTQGDLPQPNLQPTLTPVPLFKITPTSESVAIHSILVAQVALSPTLPLPTDTQAKAGSVAAAGVECPTTSDHSYTLIPMEAADTQHPDSQHGDLNLVQYQVLIFG